MTVVEPVRCSIVSGSICLAVAIDPLVQLVNERLDSLVEVLSRPRRKRPRDPEVRSLLATIYTQLSMARDSVLEIEAARQRLRQALAEADPKKLGLDAALQLNARLRELLIEFGDDPYLLSCYEEEVAFGKRPNEPVGSISWHSLYADKAPAAVNVQLQGADPIPNQRTALRNRLLALHRARWHFYGLDRGRASVKGRYMAYLAGLLLLLGIGLCAGIIISDKHHIWPQVLFVAFAGAIGSSISGAFKLRDQITTIGQLRAFAPALLAQPLIGAVAGLT